MERMASIRQKRRGDNLDKRRSTIANAAVWSILDGINSDVQGVHKGAECFYCGKPATTSDHLRPLVESSRPSGYLDEPGNLVPACQPCNSSKGNRDWRTFLAGLVMSPDERTKRTAALERFHPAKVDMRQLCGKEEWDKYWRGVEDLKTRMVELNKMGRLIGATIALRKGNG
jgi:hypothetical protein